jgi:hypothetical protein
VTRILQPSSPDVYWREVNAIASEYFAIGSLIVRAIPFDESNRTRAVAQCLTNLRGIERQVTNAEDALRGRLSLLILRDQSDQIIKFRKDLYSFVEAQSQGILDNLTTDSDSAVLNLGNALRNNDTPADYYHVANAMLYVVLALRIASFFLFDRPVAEVTRAVCREMTDLLGTAERALEIARIVGRNRVSGVDEELILIDELGPVWGTTFSIRVDGRVVYTDTFAGSREVPRRSLNEVRARADRMQSELATTNATAVADGIKSHYDLVDMIKARTCR